MRLRLNDRVSFNFKIHLVCVNAVNDCAVLFDNILNTHDRLVTESVEIDHESITGVKRVNLKRSFVRLIAKRIRDNHTKSSTANGEPIGKLFILCRFIFGKDKLVETVDSIGSGFISATVYILNWLSHKIANFERDNLVRTIFNQLIVDFRANVFCPAENRLLATVIIIEILNLAPVGVVNCHSFIHNTHNILASDFRFIRIDYSTPEHYSRIHASTSCL